MDFALSQEQQDLRAAARRYLVGRYPTTRVAELADEGRLDTDAWPDLVRQGWFDSDLGPVDLALLAEESGRSLHPFPWWTTAGWAAPVYHAAGVPLPGPVTLADGGTGCRAYQRDGRWCLTGRITGVVDAMTAVEIIVVARTGTGPALFTVGSDAVGVERRREPGIDPLRGSATLAMTDTPARCLVDGPAAAHLLAAVTRRADVLLAGEAVGVADRALDLAVTYARTRVQFDRPIGSYQAVAHLLAESYADVELARSLCYRAACLLVDGTAGIAEAVACAVHAAAQAAVAVCEASIQVAGGIGVTWEFPAHRWYRRALWTQAFQSRRPDPLTALADGLLGSHTVATR